MLCQFSVKNFKSIKEEVTLDMQAAKISEHKDNIIKCNDGENFLPIAVLYGPNGGGKSNVLEAIHALYTTVLRARIMLSVDNIEIERTPVIPFLFSKETENQPTEFEIFFRTEISEYRYILHIKDNNVIYESLDQIKLETNRKSSLFEKANGQFVLKGKLSSLKVSEDLSDDIPLLSYLGMTYRNNDIIRDVIEWFEKKITIINYGSPVREATVYISESDEYKNLILAMIKELDIDIEDFRVEKKDDGKIKIYSTHIVNGYRKELPLEKESSGTRKVFGLLPFVIASLKNGRTLVIDELDAKIHPILLKYIIHLYTDLTINTNKAQLIYTSHDLSTLSSEFFRRDEIWFVAKGNEQNSILYSLVEFKDEKGNSIRKDATYDKQYLEGKYGADPYLKKIIDWRNVNE